MSHTQLNIVQIFNKESPKKLIFIIRDFSSRENFENIKNTISSDILRIWNEIRKPNELQDVSFNRFFQLKIFTIRSLIYDLSGFEDDCRALRELLLSDSNSSEMVISRSLFKNVPLDSLFFYFKEIWHSISNNRDLNIPNQKIIVSTYRCTEVKNELLKELCSNIDSNIISCYNCT